MADEARTRRRVTAKEAAGEDPGRRRVLVLGAVLGVIAGALIAIFAIPPVFDRYFGVADVELGKAIERDGVTLRVSGVTAVDASGTPSIVVSLELSNATAGRWCPSRDRLLVEFDNMVRVAPSGVETNGTGECDNGPPGDYFKLRFETPPGAVTPLILHSRDLDARFHLQPGDPRDR